MRQRRTRESPLSIGLTLIAMGLGMLLMPTLLGSSVVASAFKTGLRTPGWIMLGLGAVAVAPRVAERFFADTDSPMFRHGLTYSGHATACVVAEANLDIVEREDLVARAGELEGVLARALAPLRDHPLVEDLRTGSGFMAGVQLRPEVSADQVAIACTEAGVLMRLIHNNTLHISPPFVVTDDEVALIATTITSALDGLL